MWVTGPGETVTYRRNVIESPPPRPVAAPPPGAPARADRRAPLPVPAGAARFLVLVGVFVCAACGLAYELELLALASYLLGDSLTQASIVLSVMVFAMGIGSLAAKRLRGHAALGFGLIEATLALVGGGSGMALYAAFTWLGPPGTGPDAGLLAWARDPGVPLVAFSLAIGMLIGAEVPLLMVLIQRIRRQDAGGAVADLFAADYVGALVGGLAFPLLLLPVFGQLFGALLTGAVNAVAGGLLVLGLFHRDLSRRDRRLVLGANVAVLVLLAVAAVLADDFERSARRAVYGDDVRAAVWTGQQEVVLTGGGDRPVRLYLDGRPRLAGPSPPPSGEGGGDSGAGAGAGAERAAREPYEALVRPALAGPRARVLLLGGGDGLTAREVLAHPGVRRLDLVDPDPGLVRLARSDPALRALNGHALRDPRVRATGTDVFDWLRAARARRDPGERYDVVICDLPGPGRAEATKLYAREFYGLARRMLAPGGRLAVRIGGPADGDGGARTLWTAEATVRAAGLRVVPYVSPGAGVRGWGVLLAGARTPGVTLPPDDVFRAPGGTLPSDDVIRAPDRTLPPGVTSPSDAVRAPDITRTPDLTRTPGVTSPSDVTRAPDAAVTSPSDVARSPDPVRPPVGAVSSAPPGPSAGAVPSASAGAAGAAGTAGTAGDATAPPGTPRPPRTSGTSAAPRPPGPPALTARELADGVRRAARERPDGTSPVSTLAHPRYG